MGILKDLVFGGPNIGIYLALNNNIFLYPPNTNPKIVKFIQDSSPNINLIETYINRASVLGVYIAMNSNGMIVPSIINDDELEKIRAQVPKDFVIAAIETEDNAYGNLILCNDKGAILSPLLVDAQKIIEKTLKVPTQILNFAKSKLPGSCSLVNNKGVVVHPLTSEKEAETIAEVLKVNIDVSTINCGNPFLRGGAIVNDTIGIFGRTITGPEIQRITEIMQIQ